MAVQVETLEKLERKITLAVPKDALTAEVGARLRRLARTAKMDGFRPGKVPFNVVAQRYGASVHYEVLNDHIGRAFAVAAREASLRVAGTPSVTESETQSQDNAYSFDAVFEVYPDVVIGDLSTAEVERLDTEVTEAAIDRTLDILRKQRRTFALRAQDAVAQEGDRVLIDFEGKIDGEPFEGGKASDFSFIVGDGQMLKVFEDAVTGMKCGESKTFPLEFPADYHGAEVAGKTADFMVTVRRIESSNLPAVDEDFARSLAIADATVDGLRADIRKNLEREVKYRLLTRNKQAVLDALLGKAELELPRSAVKAEIDRLIAGAREDLRKRGLKNTDDYPIPEDLFRTQAERRVRLGLVVAEVVRANSLFPTAEQIRKHVEELSASYEKPAEVVRWYYSDNERLAEVETIVMENNVTEFVLSKATVTARVVGFDELMGQQQ